VGTPLAARWSGHRWRIQPTPIPNRARPANGALNAVSCTSANTCLAVGQFSTHEGETPLSERWNGHSWTIPHIADPRHGGGLASISCAGARACTAVGDYGAERWNGAKWTFQATPRPDYNIVDGVSCTSKVRCIAVGAFYKAGYELTRAERWTG
jgi:hypothetical protein